MALLPTFGGYHISAEQELWMHRLRSSLAPVYMPLTCFCLWLCNLGSQCCKQEHSYLKQSKLLGCAPCSIAQTWHSACGTQLSSLTFMRAMRCSMQRCPNLSRCSFCSADACYGLHRLHAQHLLDGAHNKRSRTGVQTETKVKFQCHSTNVPTQRCLPESFSSDWLIEGAAVGLSGCISTLILRQSEALMNSNFLYWVILSPLDSNFS